MTLLIYLVVYQWASEASTSFLKKRSKKLLILRLCLRSVAHSSRHKSFLVLFFKKELLASLPQSGALAKRRRTATFSFA
jgi:hypothetical protein